MKQCWNSDPLKKPDASLLPKMFEEMMELCKTFDDNAVSSKIAFYPSLSQSTVIYDSIKPVILSII